MVGRLVKKKEIVGNQHEGRQSHPRFLATYTEQIEGNAIRRVGADWNEVSLKCIGELINEIKIENC